MPAIVPGLRLRSGRHLFTVAPSTEPGSWFVCCRGIRREVTEAFIRARFEVVS